MAHRNVHVYDLATLAAAREGAEVKPTQERESALKFLTRSIGCMADGKGQSFEFLKTWDGRLTWQAGHPGLSREE